VRADNVRCRKFLFNLTDAAAVQAVGQVISQRSRLFSLCVLLTIWYSCIFISVSYSDPDYWIRIQIQMSQGIRIQTGQNCPRKGNAKNHGCILLTIWYSCILISVRIGSGFKFKWVSGSRSRHTKIVPKKEKFRIMFAEFSVGLNAFLGA
jgi:hypothetical protein